ncbi:prepilin-type N-terminal cleavage/methylation domain-containing protein [Elusimicrobium posterum]|uniref:prepilin-type N-terminal cleavage/methylation domain-containing protein n=1 Tax=Elusimicrobium posterum TaxID=3116653 RepID=UPI003C73D24A
MNKKGFTLLELLIVVVIIAALVVIAVPQYNFTVEKGKTTQMIKMVRDIYDSSERVAFRNNVNISSVVNFNNLDGNFAAKGTINPTTTLTVENLGTFTLGTNFVTGNRDSSYGTYRIVMSKASGDAAAVYCEVPEANNDAIKICEGISTDFRGIINGFRRYKL